MYAILWLLAEEPASTHIWARSEWVPNVNARPQHSMRSHCSLSPPRFHWLTSLSISFDLFPFVYFSVLVFAVFGWSYKAEVCSKTSSEYMKRSYLHMPFAICARVMDFEERAHLRTPQWIGMMWCVCLSSSVISYFEVNAYRSIKPECVSIQSTGTITVISATPSVSLLGLSTTKARTRFKTTTRIFQKWFAYEINYFCIYLSIYWRIDV